jgi:hypothetical protein
MNLELFEKITTKKKYFYLKTSIFSCQMWLQFKMLKDNGIFTYVVVCRTSVTFENVNQNYVRMYVPTYIHVHWYISTYVARS